MELVVCKDREGVAEAVNRWLESCFVTDSASHSLYVPAGSTPEPLYQLWREQNPEYLKRLRFVQIDDVLDGPERGCFHHFLQRELGPWRSQLVGFEQGDQQAEVALLGLGLNGHVAFHEPGLSKTFYSGCLPLSKETCDRLRLEPGTWGASYGLSAFLKCKKVAVMVWGESKRGILKRFLSGVGDFPALALRDHPQLKVFVDQAALDEQSS